MKPYEVYRLEQSAMSKIRQGLKKALAEDGLSIHDFSEKMIAKALHEALTEHQVCPQIKS